MSTFTDAEFMQMLSGLSEAEKNRAMVMYQSAKKDPGTGVILSVLLGVLGVDRFWLGQMALGILKLLTWGGCGIWWLIDLFLISGAVHEYNRRKATEIVTSIKAGRSYPEYPPVPPSPPRS